MNKLIFFCLVLFSQTVNATPINNKIKGMTEGTELTMSVKLNEMVKIEAILDKTVRGNGTLFIGHTLLKIRDTNPDDGLIYQDGYLNVFLHDVNSDGVNDLIVSGVGKKTHAEGIEIRPILFIYEYSMEKRMFIQIFRNSDVEINLAK